MAPEHLEKSPLPPLKHLYTTLLSAPHQIHWTHTDHRPLHRQLPVEMFLPRYAPGLPLTSKFFCTKCHMKPFHFTLK